MRNHLRSVGVGLNRISGGRKVHPSPSPGVRVFAGVTVKPVPLVGSQQVPDGDKGRPYELVG